MEHTNHTITNRKDIYMAARSPHIRMRDVSRVYDALELGIIIADGNGPKLDAMRAFTNNDNWFYANWFECGLHNLRHQVTASKVINRKDGAIVLFYTVESQAPNGAKILGGTSSGKNSIKELTEKPFGELFARLYMASREPLSFAGVIAL